MDNSMIQSPVEYSGNDIEDMFNAISLGDIEMVTWLLSNTNLDINTIYHEYDDNNFLLAAIPTPDRNVPDNIVDIITLLIEFGIDINITDNNGLTPLDYVILL